MSISKQILSPSDYGFHNSLKLSDGSLIFLDFDYKAFSFHLTNIKRGNDYVLDHINTWDEWTSLIKSKTGLKGKDLFMPLRKALTGKDRGPELKYLLPLLSKDKILQKFGIIT